MRQVTRLHQHYTLWLVCLVLVLAGRPHNTRQALALAVEPVKAASSPPRSVLKPEYRSQHEFMSASRITDLVPLGEEENGSLSNTKPLRQQLFASPLISVLYERVLPPLWQAGLRIGGPEEEYQAAAQYLQSGVLEKGRLALDLSCGTGFVGRRMAASGYFDHVFALDYSKQMLNECISCVRRGNEQGLPLSIIRGDAGCLPFNNGVFDAVHWGAAMHCVPDAEQALQEVYRVLKPGGKLYATTFLRPFPDVVFRFFTVNELQSMAQLAGFDRAFTEVKDKGVYGIIQAQK